MEYAASGARHDRLRRNDLIQLQLPGALVHPDADTTQIDMYSRLTVVILLLLGWGLSGTIHELGHAIAGKMAGLNIVYIQLFPPGLRLSGEANRFWNAAISISGMLFAVLVGLAGSLAAILLGGKWPPIRYAFWLFLPMMGQALAWFCLSIVCVFGIEIPDSDIQKFRQHTGWSSLEVSLIVLMLIVSCAAVLKWTWSQEF